MAFFVSIPVNAGHDIVAIDFTIEAPNSAAAETTAVLAMGQLGFSADQYSLISIDDLGNVADADATSESAGG